MRELFDEGMMLADSGEVAEWLNAPVLKTGMPFGVSRVRIPPSPFGEESHVP